jgi:hypothetical protein
MKKIILAMLVSVFVSELTAQSFNNSSAKDELQFSLSHAVENKDDPIKPFLKRYNQITQQTRSLFFVNRSATKRLDSTIQNRYVNGVGFLMDVKTVIIYDQSGKHTQTKEYFYGPNSGLWTLRAEEFVTYGVNGLSVQWCRIEKQTTTGDTIQKIYVDFDSQGNVVKQEAYERTSNVFAWNGIQKDEFDFDANGDLTMMANYNWNSTTATWNGRGKMTYVYSQPGLYDFSNYFIWVSGNWVKNVQVQYLYDTYGNTTQFESMVVDVTTGVLTKSSKREWAYDASGRMTMLSIIDVNQVTDQWAPRLKREFFYNALNQDSLILWYDWTSAWELAYKTQYTYTPFNKLGMEEKSSYDFIVQQWSVYERITHAYDPQERIIDWVQEYANSSGALQNVRKETMSYGSATDEEVIYDWRNSQWWPIEKTNFTLNSNSQVINESVERGNYSILGQYSPSKELIYNYDANDNQVYYKESLYSSGAWRDNRIWDKAFDGNQKEEMFFEVYNPNGWFISRQYEYNRDVNWTLADIQVPIYYPFDVLVNDTFRYDVNPSNAQRLDDIHTQFFWSNTATSVNEINSQMLALYPNPTSEFLMVKDLSSLKATFQLFDVTGKMIRENIITPDSKIDVSSLSNGVYLFRIQDGSVSNMGQFIKE